MDNFKEYVEERMENIYSAYNSTILEAHKSESDKQHIKMCKNEFLNYLEYKYDTADVRYEIKSAKTDKEREKVAKKYAKDFEEWRKHNKTVNRSLIGMIGSGAMAGATAGVGALGASVVWMVVYFIFFGKLVKAGNAMDNARDEVGAAKYKEKNKK